MVEGKRRVGDMEPGGLGARRLAVVPDRHCRPPLGQPPCGRQPGAPQPHNRDALAFERPHRIFNVLRPTSARIMAMIQKRMTMVASAQPFFSK